MFDPETMNVIVAIVLGLHVVIELIHYAFGFIDNRRTKKILADVKALLEKHPPCIKKLDELQKAVDSEGENS